MKRHIGVDSQTRLTDSAANVHDKRPLPDLLHGNERRVYGDSGYASQKSLIASKVPIEVRRGKNRNKSRVRARVEPVFAVVRWLWGLNTVRYRTLQKKAMYAFTVLALANICMCRGQL